MSQNNWKTLRVPPEAYDDAKAQKERNERTWGEQLTAGTDDPDPESNVDEIAEAVVDLLSAEAVSIIAEVQDEMDTLAYNGQVSEQQAQRIMNRLDDLESQLPRQVAEELQ